MQAQVRERDIHYLIVSGYVRRSLSTEIVSISNHIVQICGLFYKTLFKIFIYCSDSMQISVLHIKRGRISRIMLSNHDKVQFSKPMCYIDNISAKVNIEADNALDLQPKKSYDAILCVECNKSYYYPNLLLFKSSKIENKMINCITFKSNKSLPVDSTTVGYRYGAHCPIYCGTNNGIIYEFDGDLYQLKLSEIDCNTKHHYKFTRINAKQRHFWDHIHYHHHPKYLAMSYMQHSDKIFTVKCDWKRAKWHQNNIKCAIFDLVQNEWKSITSLKYEHHDINIGYYAHQICYNQFDTNAIYCVSNKCNTAKYDFRKNVWNILYEAPAQEMQQHVLWMDAPKVLCCSNGKYFQYLDCRNNKPKWNEIREVKYLNPFTSDTNNLSVFL